MRMLTAVFRTAEATSTISPCTSPVQTTVEAGYFAGKYDDLKHDDSTFNLNDQFD